MRGNDPDAMRLQKLRCGGCCALAWARGVLGQHLHTCLSKVNHDASKATTFHTFATHATTGSPIPESSCNAEPCALPQHLCARHPHKAWRQLVPFAMAPVRRTGRTAHATLQSLGNRTPRMPFKSAWAEASAAPGAVPLVLLCLCCCCLFK